MLKNYFKIAMRSPAKQKELSFISVFGVLYASLSAITGLLSKDFIKLVLMAFVIATPLAWFAMNKWLQDFAYHTNISRWVFALAVGASVLIAFATISFQSIKATVTNPVKKFENRIKKNESEMN